MIRKSYFNVTWFMITKPGIKDPELNLTPWILRWLYYVVYNRFCTAGIHLWGIFCYFTETSLYKLWKKLASRVERIHQFTFSCQTLFMVQKKYIIIIIIMIYIYIINCYWSRKVTEPLRLLWNGGTRHFPFKFSKII